MLFLPRQFLKQTYLISENLCFDLFNNSNIKFFGGNMLFKSNFFRVITALCLAILMTTTVLADTIRLKDGSIIKGKIVSFGGGKFVVRIGQRQITYSANEVESIQFDADSMPAANVNTSSKVPTTSDKNSTIITVGQNSNTANSSNSAPKINTIELLPKKFSSR
jgi:hypothetical protein